MSISVLRDFLLWCAVLNYGILVFWFLAFSVAHAWLHRLHVRWFQISKSEFDRIHYSGMALYKVGILVFNVAPYIALRIMLAPGS